MQLQKILKNNDFSEVLKKGGIALLIRILGFLSGYLFIYFTVKYFGAETQGRLALSFSVMIIGSLICRLGVDINFVKIFAINNNLENAKGIYFKIRPIILVLAIVVSLVVFFCSDVISDLVFNDPGLNLFLKWTSPCILLFTFVLLNASVFRGLKMNALYSFLFNGGRFLFTLIFFLLFLMILDRTPYITIIAHSLSIAVLFIISVFYIYKHVYPKHKNTSYKTKGFIKQSLPMLFSTSMIIFLGWSDTIILGIYKTTDVVGIYSVVLKIAVVTSFTFQALDSILAPKLSAAYHSNDLDLFKKLVRYSTLVNLGVSLFAVAGIIIFRDHILNIFGEEFFIASTALIILCFGQLFNAICGPVGSILQMTGHQNIFQNILFIAMLLNISLNLLLIQPYGINGVAFATAFSLAFWNITSVIYIKRKVY
jgi:O-antigen/teichoic acid export membrane protein